jgi:hypothetical protein
VRFFLILVWKTGTFLQILNLISMLRMQEMVLAGFKFQKFYGGACPQTPLGRAWPSAPHVDFIQNATVRLRRWIRLWVVWIRTGLHPSDRKCETLINYVMEMKFDRSRPEVFSASSPPKTLTTENLWTPGYRTSDFRFQTSDFRLQTSDFRHWFRASLIWHIAFAFLLLESLCFCFIL